MKDLLPTRSVVPAPVSENPSIDRSKWKAIGLAASKSGSVIHVAVSSVLSVPSTSTPTIEGSKKLVVHF